MFIYKRGGGENVEVVWNFGKKREWGKWEKQRGNEGTREEMGEIEGNEGNMWEMGEIEGNEGNMLEMGDNRGKLGRRGGKRAVEGIKMVVGIGGDRLMGIDSG